MTFSNLPELDRQWSDGSDDDDLVVSANVLPRRPDGMTEVEIAMADEYGGIDCHYHVHCVWNDEAKQWFCESVEHDYSTNMPYNRECDVVSGTCMLYEAFGSMLRLAYKIPPDRISSAEVLKTSPSELQKLSQIEAG